MRFKTHATKKLASGGYYSIEWPPWTSGPFRPSRSSERRHRFVKDKGFRRLEMCPILPAEKDGFSIEVQLNKQADLST